MAEEYITEEEAKSYQADSWELDLDDQAYIDEALETANQYLNYLRWFYPI